MNENHQDKTGSKLLAKFRVTKTIFVQVVYCLAIALLTACAVTIVVKLIFWPPCTDTGKNCVIDPWSVAGLAGAVLGVAATLLAILGAVAVAAWWLELNKRVSNQVNKEVDAANKLLTEQIEKAESEQVASLNDRMTEQVNRLYSKQAKEIETAILKHIVTKFELDHLSYFNRPEAFLAEYSENFIPELQHLQLLGYIKRQHYHGFNTLGDAFRQYGHVNVKDHFDITDAGRAYLDQVK